MRPDARTSSGTQPTEAGVYAVDPGFLDRLGGFGPQAADALRAGKVVVPSKDFLTSDGMTLIGLRRDDGTTTGKSVPAVVLPGLPDLLIFQDRPVSLASPAVARELLYPVLDVDESEAVYFADSRQALAAGTAHRDGLVALMATVSEHAIGAATEVGLRFPQKSTFFEPKPRSGLVIRCFADG